VASISAFESEAIQKGRIQKTVVIEVATIVEREKIFMNLSVETKVAIAVATSFVVLMVGAMAQG
jgi:ABC-type branched-subunit amino acid transport system ATPase component